jgi:hypothetical protein
MQQGCIEARQIVNVPDNDLVRRIGSKRRNRNERDEDGRQAPDETHFRFFPFRRSRLVPITTRASSSRCELTSSFLAAQMKISRVVRVASPLYTLSAEKDNFLRKRTTRALHCDPLGGIVANEFCRDDSGGAAPMSDRP